MTATDPEVLDAEIVIERSSALTISVDETHVVDGQAWEERELHVLHTVTGVRVFVG